MVKMKSTMNSRKPKVRTNFGMGRWGEYFESRRSYMLPLGHTWPHQYLPRQMEVSTGPIMQMSANKPITG